MQGELNDRADLGAFKDGSSGFYLMFGQSQGVFLKNKMPRQTTWTEAQQVESAATFWRQQIMWLPAWTLEWVTQSFWALASSPAK